MSSFTYYTRDAGYTIRGYDFSHITEDEVDEMEDGYNLKIVDEGKGLEVLHQELRPKYYEIWNGEIYTKLKEFGIIIPHDYKPVFDKFAFSCKLERSIYRKIREHEEEFIELWLSTYTLPLADPEEKPHFYTYDGDHILFHYEGVRELFDVPIEYEGFTRKFAAQRKII